MKKTRRRLVTRWEQMDKSSTPLQTVIDHYLTTCRTEGKTPKTVKGYTEKLSRFGRWLNGSLGELTLEMVRTYIGSLQSADKWAGHPFTPTNGQRLSATSVADHVRVLKGFSTWLFEEGYKQTNELGRLALPKAPRPRTAQVRALAL